MSETLHELARTIAARASASAEKSYTKSLLDAGMGRVAKKFGEEAVETVIAAMQGERAAVIGEAADTLYHLLVLLQAVGVELREVEAELARRTVQSGLDEKAARKG